ncbi:MAG: transaldolase [Planctomycetes bacterium]|nr:transaldolase [Planctomycetota bacterium]
MSNRIRQISALGQAIWLDYISRDLLRTGKLRALLNEGVTGMTSNPSIFQKSIATGREYDDQVRELAHAGRTAYEIYEALALQDIGDAADQLRNVYSETNARDGFVSIEVNPKLAHDTQGTIDEARRLFAALGRKNVMIKVPATPAGLPAIRTLIGEGVNVNVTLIFALDMYEQVMQAYLDGLRTLRESGRPLGFVASVASFFISRVDNVIDEQLTARIGAGQRGLDTLRGQAAIANAKIAYDCYKNVFEGPPFAELKAAGARVQRPLWASTSTKNPAYSDTKYVDALIGPNTVNTVPPQTLDAIRDHGAAARTIDMDVNQAYGAIEKLKTAGIDLGAVTAHLLTDGVKQFADSFERMLADVEAKRRRFVG